MRLFYDNWQMLDSKSSVATDELSPIKSSVITDDLQKANNQIDIHNSIVISNTAKFPIEDFFQLPFSHHVEVFSKVKDLPARYYYISRAVKEHLPVESLERIIKQKEFKIKEICRITSHRLFQTLLWPARLL